MARTVFLMLGFAWFTNQGARYGNVTLAANHVLLQLVSFSAFFLDGFAFATESLAAILSFAAFLAAWWLLALEHGNRGLWIAFILYVLARAAALGVYFPGLRAAIPERWTRAA